METKTCKVPDCNGTRRIRKGLCNSCYQWCNANPGKDPVGRPRQKMNPAPSDGQCTVVENGGKCTREHRSGGMCNMHLLRKRSNGDPLITLTRPKRTLLVDLMAQATRDTDECTFLSGYSSRPSVKINDRTHTASRAAWILANGDPGRSYVLHTCNGGSGDHGCINLRHLYLGDAVQNSADMCNAGRNNPNPLKGSDVVTSKLSESEVLEIRSRWSHGGTTQKDLASEYGVSRASICNIVKRNVWSHI